IRKIVLERVKGIEPSSLAWKAVALPLSYTREDSFHQRCRLLPVYCLHFVRWRTVWPRAALPLRQQRTNMMHAGGGSWIRTNVGARPTDLQSAPFNHSGIPPKANSELCRVF